MKKDTTVTCDFSHKVKNHSTIYWMQIFVLYLFWHVFHVRVQDICTLGQLLADKLFCRLILFPVLSYVYWEFLCFLAHSFGILWLFVAPPGFLRFLQASAITYVVHSKSNEKISHLSRLFLTQTRLSPNVYKNTQLSPIS